jgi:hypothetical protein
MKAIFEMEVPGSCNQCSLSYVEQSSECVRTLKCIFDKVTNLFKRASDCPLKIVEEKKCETLQWREVFNGNMEGWYGYSIKCPKCKKSNLPAPDEGNYKHCNYCPNCGQRLLPPKVEEEKEEWSSVVIERG